MNRLIISNDGNTQSGTVSSSKNIPFMSDEYAKKQNSEKRKSDITTKNNWCIYNHRTTKTNQKYPSVNL